MATILATNPQQIRLAMLGSDILRHIFEYDGTYKQIYKKCITGGSLWSANWLRWYDNSQECRDPAISATMKWLFVTWGITKDGMDPFMMASTKFMQHHYFPTDIQFLTWVDFRLDTTEVTVYIGNDRIFTGLAVDNTYYKHYSARVMYEEENKFRNWEIVYLDGENDMAIMVPSLW